MGDRSVDLDCGPDGLAAFTKALQRRFGSRAFINNGFDQRGDAHIVGTQRAFALETAALLMFAAVAALTSVLLVGRPGFRDGASAGPLLAFEGGRGGVCTTPRGMVTTFPAGSGAARMGELSIKGG